jgi:hypothetical protein
MPVLNDICSTVASQIEAVWSTEHECSGIPPPNKQHTQPSACRGTLPADAHSCLLEARCENSTLTTLKAPQAADHGSEAIGCWWDNHQLLGLKLELQGTGARHLQASQEGTLNAAKQRLPFYWAPGGPPALPLASRQGWQALSYEPVPLSQGPVKGHFTIAVKLYMDRWSPGNTMSYDEKRCLVLSMEQILARKRESCCVEKWLWMCSDRGRRCAV